MTTVNYDIVHKRFAEKVKDRRIIPWEEYRKICDEILEELPEFKAHIYDYELWDVGYFTDIRADENGIPQMYAVKE